MKFPLRLIARFLKFPKFLLLGLMTYSLTACQGSNLGSSLEGAIAPAIPANESSPATIDEKPKPSPIITPSPTPTNSPTSTTDQKSSDRRSNPLAAEIALPNLPPKTTSPKIPLKQFLYIDFANSNTPKTSEFSDIEQAPASLRDWIKDLNKLGTISAKTGQEFKPNILVARREYARWLLQTNNRLYKNQPSRQIRLAQPNDSASFPDIPNSHPDFAIIQGLANAGLINGTGDRFRPNDPLLREELVQWKIPLDLRQPLPSATWDNISQTWGFKDSDRISESALGAIFADAQLRDISNIRRSFGFTTILQPQKPVTRAEAAASLWYFGTATDGISASKILDLEKSQN
jgi:hypothetical protein